MWVNCLLLCCFVCQTFVESRRFDYTAKGDVIIAALLPLSQGKFPNNTENPLGILYAETIIYSLQRASSQLNYTFGYIIRDTCNSAQIASEIAFNFTKTWRNNKSHSKQRNIVAVITDGENVKITKAISGMLQSYNLPQIVIQSQDFASLTNGITRASADLMKTLHNSSVAVHTSGKAVDSSFLKDLRTEGACVVDGVGESSLAINPGSTDRRWEMTRKADLELVVSGVGKGIEVVKNAGGHGIQYKTWVIIADKMQSYYNLQGVNLKNETVFVLSRNPVKYPPSNFLQFQRWLIYINETSKKRPWRLKRLKSLVSHWSSFLSNYPCFWNSHFKEMISSLNSVVNTFNTISSLRFALSEITCDGCNSTSNKPKLISHIRNKIKNSFLTGKTMRQMCDKASPRIHHELPCRQRQIILSKAVLDRTCHRWSFEPVGTWTNTSGWNINPEVLEHFEQGARSWECSAGGLPVELPLKDCRQKACLTCPDDWEKENDSCRLCTFNKCSDMTLSYVSFAHPFALIITCFCVLGEIVVVLVVVIFAKYRRTPVVKSSNRMFNFVILTTVGFWFAVIPSFLSRPNYMSCNIFMAFFPMVYATVSSLLLNKTVRLLLIFNSMQKASKWLGNTSFFLTTVALIFIQVGLSITNFVVYPVDLKRILYDDAVLLHCGRSLSPVSAAGFTYNCFLSCVCGVFAFRARKLPQNFNEAKNMFSAIFSYTVSWTIVILGYYTEKLASQQTAVVSLGFAIGAFSVLACLFFPKVYVILFYPQLNTKSATLEGARRYSVDAAVNIGAFRGQRSRSSTVDMLCTKPMVDQSVVTNGRPRTISDSSFMQLVSDERHKTFMSFLTDTSGSPTSIGTCVSTISHNSSV